MTARNRVTPMGEIEAFPLRGAWTGNRGILHRGHEIVRLHASDLWITCALEFRGRRHQQWQPHHYTFLFVGDQLIGWTREGYGNRRRRSSRGTAEAVTPPSTIAALRAGYQVQIDACVLRMR